MGFGTLFIGYFLLLNVTYYSYTDLICALIMALGLYKLSTVNRYFKYTLYTALAFAAVGATEFVREVILTFSPTANLSLEFLPILRSAALCALTVCLLLGIREVATEVDLPSLATRAKRMTIPAALIYLSAIILDTPSLFASIEPIAVAVVFVLLLIATLFLIINNLITIYSAYMRICMPSELTENKQSRFEFVNKFRKYEEEKSAEYAKYRQ